jgi:hypothetical protein
MGNAHERHVEAYAMKIRVPAQEAERRLPQSGAAAVKTCPPSTGSILTANEQENSTFELTRASTS